MTLRADVSLILKTLGSKATIKSGTKKTTGYAVFVNQEQTEVNSTVVSNTKLVYFEGKPNVTISVGDFLLIGKSTFIISKVEEINPSASSVIVFKLEVQQ